MQGKEKKKIVYTDSGIDKAISGFIVGEDDFFFIIKGLNGIKYKIGKKAIVCIKESDYNGWN